MWLLGYFRNALQNLRINPMRTFLSILGLVIGVLSVTVMFSVGEWLQNQILAEMEDVTTNTITVVAGNNFNPFAPTRSAELPGFTDTDIAFFEEAMGFVTKTTPVAELSEPVYVQGEQVDVRVAAGDQDYINLEWFKFLAGRTLTDQDIVNHSNVVVISEDFATDYLETNAEWALWKQIRIANQYLDVVGVFDTQWGGLIEMKIAVIPISTAQQKITSDPFYPYLVFEIDPEIPTSEAMKFVKYTLLKRQGASHIDDALFQVYSTETMMEQINSISLMLQLALLGIWGIALLVGGIGVMNIMLVSVTERTREIWIRKAVWAKYRDILLQFLTESVVLGLLGCAVGVLLSRLIVLWLQYLGVPALLNIKTMTIAVVFSSFTGIIFGVWPARKAAKMKPIDALRFE